jgi:sugar phosphate isomerase/epimerase
MQKKLRPQEESEKQVMKKYLFYVAMTVVIVRPAFAKEHLTTPVKSNPFFALCMDTHDSQKRTLEQQAQLLHELGYDGAGHLWLKNVPERLQTLNAVGLKLFHIYLAVNIAPNAKEAYDPNLLRIAPLLNGRDTALVLLINGFSPSDPAGDTRAVDIVRRISGLASDSDLKVVLYPHTNYWLERVEDGLRLAKKVDRPNVGVMFNLCHWLKVDQEKNLVPLLTSAMPYLSAISIHGADRAANIKSGTGNWIQPLDSGAYDLASLLKTLSNLGYRGPVGLQCYGIGGDARDHLTRSMSAWKDMRSALICTEPGTR